MFDNIKRYFKGLKICYVCKRELNKDKMFYIPVNGVFVFIKPRHKSCYECRLKKAKEIGNPLMVSFPYEHLEKIKIRRRK